MKKLFLGLLFSLAATFATADSVGPYSDSWFELVRAEIKATYGHDVTINRKSLHKFGRAEAIGTTETSINILSRDEVFPTTNAIDTISSTNAADTQVIRIEGMVLNGDSTISFTVQTATLNGQNKVTLGTPLFRATRMSNNSDTATAGSVYIYQDGTVTGGIPDDLNDWHGTMDAGAQSTLKAGTTIASNNYFIMTRWDAFVNRQQNAAVDFRLKYNECGKHLPTKLFMSSRNTSSQASVSFAPFLIIPPKHDIRISAISTASGTAVNSSFFGFFADINE